MNKKQIEAFRKNVGSISSGTMRPEDLIPSFIYEARSQRPLLRSHSKQVTDIDKRSAKRGYYESDAPGDDLECLFDILGHYAPEGFYFGAHPGDGADYGYWLNESFIDDFDGLKVSDLSEVPRGYRGLVLYVNDHGNTALYSVSRGKFIEHWAIV